MSISYELLAYRHMVNSCCGTVCGQRGEQCSCRTTFITTDDISPRQHVDVQAAAQKWIGFLHFKNRQRAH